VRGPSWIIARDGRRFDELVEGDRAAQALLASAVAAIAPVKARARRKLDAGDFAGAIVDLDSCLAIHPADEELPLWRRNALAGR